MFPSRISDESLKFSNKQFYRNAKRHLEQQDQAQRRATMSI